MSITDKIGKYLLGKMQNVKEEIDTNRMDDYYESLKKKKKKVTPNNNFVPKGHKLCPKCLGVDGPPCDKCDSEGYIKK